MGCLLGALVGNFTWDNPSVEWWFPAFVGALFGSIAVERLYWFTELLADGEPSDKLTYGTLLVLAGVIALGWGLPTLARYVVDGYPEPNKLVILVQLAGAVLVVCWLPFASRRKHLSLILSGSRTRPRTPA